MEYYCHMSAKILQIAHTVIQSPEWKDAAAKFNSDLCGMCAIASAITFRALRYRRIEAEICANDMHCWLHVTVNGKVYALDLTAKQFGFYGDVLFCPADAVLETMNRDLKRDYMAAAWRTDCYSFTKFTSTTDLRIWQRKNEWPEEQIV